MRVAGIMSGTSLDGIDVAIIDFAKRQFEVVEHRSVPYPAKIRERLMAVSNAVTHVAEISRLDFLLPELYAKALRRCTTPLDSLELIGCHGQTIYHETGSTLQIGDGSVLAELTGVPVVSDFRPRDIAAGGHGAPLVPFVDYLLFRHRKLGRVALNIGGIANLTAIPPAGAPESVLAFDTGPGNMVVDQLVHRYTRGKQRFDKGGVLGMQGRVQTSLLDELLRAEFYRKPPPKTAGREQYGGEFVDRLIATKLPMLDLIATATVLTPASIALGIEQFVEFSVDELIVAGGGAHNRTIMAYLQSMLPNTTIRTTTEFGIDSDAKEAIAFAVLAHQTWKRLTSNLPSATGARHPVILGKVSF